MGAAHDEGNRATVGRDAERGTREIMRACLPDVGDGGEVAHADRSPGLAVRIIVGKRGAGIRSKGSLCRERRGHGDSEHYHVRETFSPRKRPIGRSEEHTSELQSLMRTSYAVFCLKKKNTKDH